MDNNDPKKDPIAKLLNLDPLPLEVKKENQIIEFSEPESDFEQASGDFDVARDALNDALAISQEAMTELLSLAKQSQSPRAFEVLAKFVDTVRETSKGVIDIHQKKKDLMKSVESPQTINNNLTITSAEMLKMIKSGNNGS